MKFVRLILVNCAVLWLVACGIPGVTSGPHNPIEGKWKNADGSYVVEFLPSGDCSAHMRMQGHDVGGPCKYDVGKDTITVHYYGMGANPGNAPDRTAAWQYTLNGDTLTVSVLGNTMALQRAH
jgi:hypothetical protein